MDNKTKKYSINHIGEERLTLTGKADDALWKKAIELTDFSSPWEDQQVKRTEFRALKNKDRLFFCFKVYDSQGRVLPISDNSSWTKIARRFVSFVRGRGYTPAGGAGPNYMGDTVHFDIARGYTSTTQSNFWISTKSGVSSSQKIRTTPWLAEFK